jgi:hypothetical protein
LGECSVYSFDAIQRVWEISVLAGLTSWSKGEQSVLDLFIEPCQGFTQKLLEYSKSNRPLCLALFSGPHGTSALVGEYETVLMIASGFGIAAQLSYLRQLIYRYNACKTHTCCVHLVWQLETLGKLEVGWIVNSRWLWIDIGIAVESLLNNALADDTLDKGYVSYHLTYVFIQLLT